MTSLISLEMPEGGIFHDWMLSEQAESSLPFERADKEGLAVSPMFRNPTMRALLTKYRLEPRGRLTAVGRERLANGAWIDRHIVRFSRLGLVKVDQRLWPRELLQDILTDPTIEPQFQAACASTDWGEQITLDDFDPRDLPAPGQAGELFLFRSAPSGAVVFIQQRLAFRDRRLYVPWTPVLRNGNVVFELAEPEGGLPLFGAERLTTVDRSISLFIHESPRAAEAAQRIAERQLEDHPWADELANTVHVGWVGGALNAHRTSFAWPEGCSPREVIIATDNDEAGRLTVGTIAKKIHIATRRLRHTEEFPIGWDFADPLPRELFIDGVWTGPALRSLIRTCTYAADRVPGSKPAQYVLRPAFGQDLVYVADSSTFSFFSDPTIRYPAGQLNDYLGGLSDTRDIAQLYLDSDYEKFRRMTYEPGRERQPLVNDLLGGTGMMFNTYLPPSVVAVPGDCEIIHELIRHMVPDEADRRFFLRWIATLIARPEVRMTIAVLAISGQGTGKNTIADHILAPLVGRHNCSWPSQADLESNFNGWAAHRRLIIASEVYSGHSKATYNRLKAIITDHTITVNEKYREPYVIKNVGTIFACSNDRRPLMVENSDRRWFMPTINDVPWPREKFNELYKRLAKTPLLSHFLYWAETFGDYITDADRVPMTVQKKQTIHESKTQAEVELEAYAEAMLEARFDGDAIAGFLDRRMRSFAGGDKAEADGWSSSESEVPIAMAPGRGRNQSDIELGNAVLRVLKERVDAMRAAPGEADRQMPVAVLCKSVYEKAMERSRRDGANRFSFPASVAPTLLKNLGLWVTGRDERVKIGGVKQMLAATPAANDLIDEIVAEICVGVDGSNLVPLVRNVMLRLLMVPPNLIIEDPIQPAG